MDDDRRRTVQWGTPMVSQKESRCGARSSCIIILERNYNLELSIAAITTDSSFFFFTLHNVFSRI